MSISLHREYLSVGCDEQQVSNHTMGRTDHFVSSYLVIHHQTHINDNLPSLSTNYNLLDDLSITQTLEMSVDTSQDIFLVSHELDSIDRRLCMIDE